MGNLIKLLGLALVLAVVIVAGIVFAVPSIRQGLFGGEEKTEQVEEEVQENETAEGESPEAQEGEVVEAEQKEVEQENENHRSMFPQKKREPFTSAEVDKLGVTLSKRLKGLKKQEVLLENRMRGLDEREKNILAMQTEIRQLHAQIAQFIPMIEASEKKNLKKLAKMFATLSPENASPLIAQMPDDTVVNVLAYMKPRNSASILSGYAALNPQNAKRAAKITESLRNLVIK